MAEARFVLQVLSEIQAYYGQTYNSTQVAVLVRQLKVLPAWALRMAADEWLDTETRWLPRGSQLLATARKLMARFRPDTISIPEQLQKLKDSWYRDGYYDQTRWTALLSLAEELEMPSSADAIRRAQRAVTDPQDEDACLARGFPDRRPRWDGDCLARRFEHDFAVVRHQATFPSQSWAIR